MIIHVETTPNPQSLKFMPDRVVLAPNPNEENTQSFLSVEQAKTSPLAQAVMSIDGVQAVFFGYDFVTVTKKDLADWTDLKPKVLQTMMDHFLSGRPVMGNRQETKTSSPTTQDPLTEQIRELIETRIRPAVAMDGGDITLDRFEDGVVYVHMKGACSGCPSSTATLKSGIENMLRYYVPEVLEVRPVEFEDDV